jgi:hypothetical protein
MRMVMRAADDWRFLSEPWNTQRPTVGLHFAA